MVPKRAQRGNGQLFPGFSPGFNIPGVTLPRDTGLHLQAGQIFPDAVSETNFRQANFHGTLLGLPGNLETFFRGMKSRFRGRPNYFFVIFAHLFCWGEKHFFWGQTGNLKRGLFPRELTITKGHGM